MRYTAFAASAVSFAVIAAVTGQPLYLIGIAWAAMLGVADWRIHQKRTRSQVIRSGDGSYNVQAGRDINQLAGGFQGKRPRVPVLSHLDMLSTDSVPGLYRMDPGRFSDPGRRWISGRPSAVLAPGRGVLVAGPAGAGEAVRGG